MSRVDDANAERKAEQARQAARRAEENARKKVQGDVSAFDRAMVVKGSEQVVQNARTADAKERISLAERVNLSMKMSDQGPGGNLERKQDVQEKGRERDERGSSRQETTRQADDRLGSHRSQGMKSQSQAQQGTQSRVRAHVEQRESQRIDDLIFQAQAELKESKARAGGGHPKVGQAEDAGEGGGGNDQSSGGGDKKDKQEQAFKLPPAALMAPPPIARPRDASQQKVRAFTQEIVNKIVNQVIIGTNKEGNPEFLLQLKSSIFQGLWIKVSGGKGGRVQAEFSGKDPEVLAVLKRSSEELTSALRSKGLTLRDEDLVFKEIQPL